MKLIIISFLFYSLYNKFTYFTLLIYMYTIYIKKIRVNLTINVTIHANTPYKRYFEIHIIRETLQLSIQ